MFVSGIDKNTTQTLRQSEKRKNAFEEQKQKEAKHRKMESDQQAEANAEFFAESGSEAADNEKKQSDDPDWDPNIPSTGPKTRNYFPLPRTGQACDRRGISSEAAADIINAYSMDMGFLTDENKLTMTVDKSKLARWRKAGRIQMHKKQIEEIGSKPVTALYFDSKNDCTLTRVQKGDRFYTKTIIEDHYMMLEEPGNIYLGHEVPLSGHGISIGLKLFRFFERKGLGRKSPCCWS